MVVMGPTNAASLGYPSQQRATRMMAKGSASESPVVWVAAVKSLGIPRVRKLVAACIAAKLPESLTIDAYGREALEPEAEAARHVLAASNRRESPTGVSVDPLNEGLLEAFLLYAPYSAQMQIDGCDPLPARLEVLDGEDVYIRDDEARRVGLQLDPNLWGVFRRRTR